MISVNRIVSQYKKKRDAYSNFSLAVKSILEQLLRNSGYKYTAITCRPKEVEKLKEKILRKKDKGHIYKNLEEIEDLAGVRIIFYLESDRQGFLDVLHGEFGKSMKVENIDKLNGYKATHVILTLDAKRSALTEYKQHMGLKCEIQLNSIFYHAWSEMEHDIIYKPDENLETLGVEELGESFAKMSEHITSASLLADIINDKYQKIKKVSLVIKSDFVSRILKSNNNDEIFETLQLFEDLFYRSPKEVYSLASAVIFKKPAKSKIVGNFGGENIYGKTHEEITMKALGLLNKIRYDKPDEILKLSFDFIKSENKNISGEAKIIITEISKYNFFILSKTNIGYGAQRKVLDFILSLSDEDKKNGLDFIEVALKEILTLSFNSLTHDEIDKFTMHSGALKSSEFLANLRRESINLIFSLIKKVGSIDKLRLIRAIGEAIKMPINYDYSNDENFKKMVEQDVFNIISGFRDILFGDENLITVPGIIIEVDRQLYWINKNNFLKSSESENLKTDIYSNESYNLFISIIGDRILSGDNLAWDELEKNKSVTVDNIIEKITEESLAEWSIKLNIIAEQIKFVEEWQFSYFRRLLQKFSQEKPELAFKILSEAFKRSAALISYHFLTYFLDGFRHVKRFDLWDLAVNLIIESKESSFVPAIFYSFGISRNFSSDEIRKYDLELFYNVIHSQNYFSYLNRKDDWNIASSIISGLIGIYKSAPVDVEKLIIDELDNYNFAKNNQLSHIATGIIRGEIDCGGFTVDGKNKIKKWLINFEKLDWDAQDLLLNISVNNPKLIIDVMIKRIEKDIKKKKRKENIFDYNTYEPIPYHFNENLVKEINNNPALYSSILAMISKSDPHWSLYNWHVGQFLSRIGGPSKEALLTLIKTGESINLKRAVNLIDHFGGIDVELCLEIVKRTDDKRILSGVKTLLYSTGVVSGLYGLSDAYESKSKMFEAYLNDTNERIKVFAKELVESFKKSSLYEKKRASEEEKMRNIMYEN